MKKTTFLALFIGASLAYLNSCTKEELKPTSSNENIENFQVKKEVATSCTFSPIYTTSYTDLGFSLFAYPPNIGLNTIGSMDKYLNCPQDYFDRCNVVNVTNMSLNANLGTVLSDGVMTVAEQQTLANQIKAEVRNYLDTYHSTSHIVTHYDVSFSYPLCCPQSVFMWVDFTAATHCRN